jgi:ribosomal protein S16
MALTIRLSRIGAIHQPIYHVVVAEARSRRDGRAVEMLGTFSPRSKAADALTLKVDRAEEKDLMSHRGKSLRSLAPHVIQLLASLR